MLLINWNLKAGNFTQITALFNTNILTSMEHWMYSRAEH